MEVKKSKAKISLFCGCSGGCVYLDTTNLVCEEFLSPSAIRALISSGHLSFLLTLKRYTRHYRCAPNNLLSV